MSHAVHWTQEYGQEEDLGPIGLHCYVEPLNVTN